MAARAGARAVTEVEEMDTTDEQLNDIDSAPAKLTRAERKAMQQMDGTKKKGKGGIIAIVILVLILGGATAAIILDIANVRTQHIMPLLRNIPLVGTMIPAAEVVEADAPLPTFDELYGLHTASEARIARLEADLSNREAELAIANETINNLRGFQVYFNEYLLATAEWNRQIAHADPVTFAQEFYGFISEAHIPQLLEEVMAINEFNEGINRQARIISGMDESSAGEMLASYLFIDSSLVQQWLRAMSNSTISEIFDTVEPSVAANLMMLLTPSEPVFSPMLAPELAIPLPPPPPPPTPVPVEVEEDDEADEEDETAAADEPDDEEVDEETDEEAEETDTEGDE